jgi:hypothetical protein
MRAVAQKSAPFCTALVVGVLFGCLIAGAVLFVSEASPLRRGGGDGQWQLLSQPPQPIGR